MTLTAHGIPKFLTTTGRKSANLWDDFPRAERSSSWALTQHKKPPLPFRSWHKERKAEIPIRWDLLMEEMLHRLNM